MGLWAMPCRLSHFLPRGGHIKGPAKEKFCADDEAATEEARQLLLDESEHSLEVWQKDRRVKIINPSKTDYLIQGKHP
jgi:hypothetical protein